MSLTDTIIVTGGAGLIGSNLAAALNARGYKNLVIVDHLNHPGKKRNLSKIEYTDFMDKQDFRKRFTSGKQPTANAVFHLGACSSTTENNAEYLDDNNLAYTRELCQWSLDHQARFIYASSAATYGDGSRGYRDDETDIPNLVPLNLYGLSKQKFDLWALNNQLLDKIVGIKYFNVFGPGEAHKGDMRSVVNKAFNQISETGTLQLFRSHRPDYQDGMQERDFVYVNDAVAITLFFFDNPNVSGIFNAGTGRTHTWLDLAHAVFAALEREPNIEFVDMPLSLREKYQYYTLADIQKLRSAGFEAPFQPLAESVADYAKKRLD
jgi:ADP-L-glycero-D-manno-heptose 6-epimerase